MAAATPVEAKGARPNQVDIQYVAPQSADHQQLYELLKEHRVLERLRTLLSPFRLPRRLLIKTEGCDGVSNAWYDGESVTVCYEFLDDIWKNAPDRMAPFGVSPVDGLIGPLMDVFLHETGHAVFDILQVPIFGREEDAADQFSTYIMLKFPKEDARRLILGNAYQYKGDLQARDVTVAVRHFADEHGEPAQRFFNVLCTAYGADKALFADFVSKGLLPKDRAEGCEDEYKQVTFAFDRLIRPHVDRELARKLYRQWLPPIDRRPQRRPQSASSR
jgi:hypothetical protein